MGPTVCTYIHLSESMLRIASPAYCPDFYVVFSSTTLTVRDHVNNTSWCLITLVVGENLGASPRLVRCGLRPFCSSVRLRGASAPSRWSWFVAAGPRCSLSSSYQRIPPLHCCRCGVRFPSESSSWLGTVSGSGPVSP